MNGLFTFPWKEIKNRNKAELQNICQQLCIPFSKGTNKNDLIKNVLQSITYSRTMTIKHQLGIFFIPSYQINGIAKHVYRDHLSDDYHIRYNDDNELIFRYNLHKKCWYHHDDILGGKVIDLPRARQAILYLDCMVVHRMSLMLCYNNLFIHDIVNHIVTIYKQHLDLSVCYKIIT